MRGPDEQASHLFSYIVPEDRVRQDHPLRAIRGMTDTVLATLSPRFDRMYSDLGPRRFRRSNCCARCCCSRCTRSAASGC